MVAFTELFGLYKQIYLLEENMAFLMPDDLRLIFFRRKNMN